MFDIVAGCCQDSTMDLASYVILQVQIIIISPVYYFSGMFEFLQLFARVQHNITQMEGNKLSKQQYTGNKIVISEFILSVAI